VEEEAEGVLRLAGEIAVGDVDDREARLREPLGDGTHRADLRVTDAEDEVVALPRERGEVGDVVRGRARLGDADGDAEALLRLEHADIGEVVEAAVVEAADVGDHPDFQGRSAGGSLATGPAREQRQRTCDNDPALHPNSSGSLRLWSENLAARVPAMHTRPSR
jgi:hypothetical protein